MKNKIFTSLALMCCFIICFVIVADLSGAWTGTLSTPAGNFPLKYTFKTDGTTLSGTTMSQQGEVPITDTEIKGNEFSFHTTYNGGDVINIATFYPDADSVALDVVYKEYKMHTTLKRAAQ